MLQPEFIQTLNLSEMLNKEVLSFEIVPNDIGGDEISHWRLDAKTAEDTMSLHIKRSRKKWGRKEIMLYQEILPLSKVPVPQLYHSVYREEDDSYLLFLEYVGSAFRSDSPRPGLTGKDWAPWSKDIFALLALIHSEFMEHEELPEQHMWLAQNHSLGVYPAYPDDYESELQLCETLSSTTDIGLPAVPHTVIDSIPDAITAAGRPPYTLCHGDFRPLNIAIKAQKLYIYDWELAAWGSPARDFGPITDRFGQGNIDLLVDYYINTINQFSKLRLDLQSLRAAIDAECFINEIYRMIYYVNRWKEGVDATPDLVSEHRWYLGYSRACAQAETLANRSRRKWN